MNQCFEFMGALITIVHVSDSANFENFHDHFISDLLNTLFFWSKYAEIEDF